MQTVEDYVNAAEMRLELIVQGEVRYLAGSGQLADDEQLGRVLRVRIDDPASGDPEFVFPVATISHDGTVDFGEISDLRLRVDVDRGTVRASYR